MVTFNIFGNCVSRDILNPLTNRNKAEVLQYTGFVNPISVFSGKGEFEMKTEHLENGSNFGKRTFCQEWNKTSIDYFTKRQADYAIIDFIGARLNVLKKDNHLISCFNTYYQNKTDLEEKYGLDKYQKIKFSEISIDELIQNVDKFCRVVLNYYPLNKIIINEYYGVEEYIDLQQAVRPFRKDIADRIRSYNKIVKKLNEYAREVLSGCHIVKFADNVIADKSNVLGLHSLHYNFIYYEYGAKAIETIVQNLPNNEEVEILEDLRQICSDRFELLRKRSELKSKAFVLTTTQNALTFTKALCFDRWENDTFYKNIEKLKANNQKVAILRSSDVAGQILLKALEKCKVDVIFTTAASDLTRLSDEDFEKCRQADIIISANVHSNVTTERDGIKAVLIKDLLG